MKHLAAALVLVALVAAAVVAKYYDLDNAKAMNDTLGFGLFLFVVWFPLSDR